MSTRKLLDASATRLFFLLWFSISLALYEFVEWNWTLVNEQTGETKLKAVGHGGMDILLSIVYGLIWTIGTMVVYYSIEYFARKGTKTP
jgi:hypothetical protein